MTGRMMDARAKGMNNMGKRYTTGELLGMTAGRLQEVATEAGMKKKFHKNLTRKDRAQRILEFYAEQDVETNTTAGVSGAHEPQRPANPAFESQCGPGASVNLPANGVTEPADNPGLDAESAGNHGGARPGAGRPAGMTAERARLTHITDTPHRIYKAGFKLLFDLWADKVGCEKVALTEEEATDIALPWSQMGEYLGWNEKIPEWADIIICGLWTTANTFKIKARIAREFREQQRSAAGEKSLTETQVKTLPASV